MRRRFQRGSVQKQRNRWVGRWYEGGSRKARVLGQVGKMTKAQAQVALAAILAPINEATDGQDNRETTFGEFVEAVFLPCYRRRWKASTAGRSGATTATWITPLSPPSPPIQKSGLPSRPKPAAG